MEAKPEANKIPMYVAINVVFDAINYSTDLSDDQKDSLTKDVAAAAIREEAAAKPLTPTKLLTQLGETIGVSPDPEKIREEFIEAIRVIGRLENTHGINPTSLDLSSRLESINRYLNALEGTVDSSHDRQEIQNMIIDVLREVGIPSPDLNQRTTIKGALIRTLGDEFSDIDFR